MNHILIQKALIYDGMGSDAFTGDIRILGDLIADIGKNLPQGDAQVIAGDGLIACPGFIDMHSHADLVYLKKPQSDEKIRQGVTTELLGQDGLGVTPYTPESLPDLQEIISGLQGRLVQEAWQWPDFSDYLAALERKGTPTNVAVLACHGPIRLAAVGMAKRKVNEREMDRMLQMLEDCFIAGAFGLSTGLEYPPMGYSDEQELTALNRVTAKHDGVYVVHQRNEKGQIKASFQEQINIARGSGARLHVSHLKTWGAANWKRIDEILDMADAFAGSGGSITWDRYPYLAGSTLLGIILPDWVWADGTQALIDHLTQADFRRRLRETFQKGPDEWEHDPVSIGWDNILISGVNLEQHNGMVGKSIALLAADKGMDPVDLVCDLMASERLSVTAIFFFGHEAVLQRVLAHPLGCVGSDGVHLGNPHPRLYGSMPRFIQQFVLEKKILTMEEAIRKVTSLPAQILALEDRGKLQAGMKADVVLFEPDRLAAPVSYQGPPVYPEGIEHVILNGSRVVRDGEYEGAIAGQVLRKS